MTGNSIPILSYISSVIYVCDLQGAKIYMEVLKIEDIFEFRYKTREGVWVRSFGGREIISGKGFCGRKSQYLPSDRN